MNNQNLLFTEITAEEAANINGAGGCIQWLYDRFKQAFCPPIRIPRP